MSIIDYQQSQKLSMSDPSFDALIMSAMRKADTNNQELLALAFPRLLREFIARYNAPGGALTEEDFAILEHQRRLREQEMECDE